jgi:hypothetical protein
MEDAIRANAELVRGVAARDLGVLPSFDLDGVRWLNQFIDNQAKPLSEDLQNKLVQTLGSYLGECIRETYGGVWVESTGSWAVRFSEGNEVFPFNKVWKQFENGPEDSVLSMFSTIEHLYFQNKANGTTVDASDTN